MQQDKRTRFSGEFRGAPARGRGQFGRGQPSRPIYPAPPPPPRGAPARLYFSAMPESSYHPPVHQGSSGAYFSAMLKSSYLLLVHQRSSMPESSNRPPAIQGSSSGYSGDQGQALGKQSMVLRGCYECGDPGHMKRTCPRLQGKAVQQGHQPIIAAPAARLPRVGGHAGRGRPRGGGQAGGGQPAIVQPAGGQPAVAPARFYAFSARPEAMASDAVITGIICVCGRAASVLFYPGSTYSYVSSMFAHFLDIPRESLCTPIYVSTPMGDYVAVDRIYRSCVVTFYGYETREDLLLLDMIDFEVILGMDWLSPYHDILDCHAKTVTLAMPELPRLEWKGSSVSTSSQVISFLKARHLVEKGCLAYLAYVRDTTAESPMIDSVREFVDVFPSDLPGMPPDRDIDFCIDLALGTQPISIPPYGMAPKELQEPKEQLEELLAKRIIAKLF
ncbi:uncharacterized protein [Nicotiana tomentosiformis]|uniref:uncharacterized protein n=1 Tax=Nicotiana tomentosiformis TaxID=4098 RepID=UPI00388CE8E3